MIRVFRLAVTGLLGLATFSAIATAASPTTAPAPEPTLIQSSGFLHVMFGPEKLALPRGLQPSLLVMRSGSILLQAQVPDKPFPSTRMSYPFAMSTRVSRDAGATWTNLPLKPGNNGLDMEGGIVQLRDGTILALDTYITPAAKSDHGIGQLYTSTDDWRTVNGPIDVDFDLPGIEFYGSTDDGGRPHAAQRLHRRIVEMPDGSLLTTFYGWLKGDHAPSQYEPTMMKTRVMVAKSTDRGMHWKLLAALAADFTVGTEGFGEAVLCRVNHGPLTGRLICMMRTGRALHESVSDDNGLTWTAPAPRVFADRDIYKTELWANLFVGMKNAKGKVITATDLDDLRGSVVDPDLIQTRGGILVAAFGVRIPQKLCWRNPTHPWNGNYLAFSRDGGKTWPDVAQITSGVLTTHYMAIEETPRDNELYVTYDRGGWSRGMPRDVFARTVKLSVAPR